MGSSQSEPRGFARWLSWMPSLRVVVGVVLVLGAVGFGVHSAMNRHVDSIDDSELESLDDFVDIEKEEPAMGRPRALTSATITDVVPAVHQEGSGERTGVQMAAHSIGVRPESQPPVWLSGTIEDTDGGPKRGDENQGATPFRRFQR